MGDFDLKLRLGLHWNKLFRIRSKSRAFQNRIDFAVYTQVDESEIKTLCFDRVSGDLNPKLKEETLNQKTFESAEFCGVNDFLMNCGCWLIASFCARSSQSLL